MKNRKDLLEFLNRQENKNLTPEELTDKLCDFLSIGEWANYILTDISVTSIEEYVDSKYLSAKDYPTLKKLLETEEGKNQLDTCLFYFYRKGYSFISEYDWEFDYHALEREVKEYLEGL